MKKLYIDGMQIGNCVEYWQDSDGSGYGHGCKWVFALDNGINVHVPFHTIRWFDSSSELKIALNS